MSQALTQPDASKRSHEPAILRAIGVRKSFRMGDSTVEVLKNSDLSVRSGEFIAIEGRSGSGKSTLLHIMGALDSADGGSVEFGGNDIVKLSADERSRLRNEQFGFVFQFYYLLPELNVLENTLLSSMVQYSWFGFRAKKRELRERGVEVLRSLGM
ncbi:MAG: ATP-binding cassette domain-containing protein, partial [Anaerolineae bacterium]|nr:ATP-binding cassette domain-containing protein [Phycisphaerae bacterium]